MFIHIKPIPDGAKCDAERCDERCGEEATTGVFPYEHIYVCQTHSFLIAYDIIPADVKGKFDKLEQERGVKK